MESAVVHTQSAFSLFFDRDNLCGLFHSSEGSGLLSDIEIAGYKPENEEYSQSKEY